MKLEVVKSCVLTEGIAWVLPWKRRLILLNEPAFVPSFTDYNSEHYTRNTGQAIQHRITRVDTEVLRTLHHTLR